MKKNFLADQEGKTRKTAIDHGNFTATVDKVDSRVWQRRQLCTVTEAFLSLMVLYQHL
jgi:hypothetical protein